MLIVVGSQFYKMCYSKSMYTNLIKIQNVSVRNETLNNVDYVVVPVVAIKEGVLNNLYYSSDVIKESAEYWNGVVLTVNHPVDTNGHNISANRPDVENSVAVGKLFNCTFEDNGLKGEMYINIQQCKDVGYEEILDRIANGEMIEVSTGLTAPINNSSGEFMGKKYSAVIEQIRPDHLAILPNDIGACSIKDGCGAMRTNCDTDKKCTRCSNMELKKEQAKLINNLKLTVNQLSFDDIYFAIDDRLYEEYGEVYPFIIEVYSDHFIYIIGSTYYQQKYRVTNSDKVEFIGNFEMVVRVVSYESRGNGSISDDLTSPSYLESNMSKEEEQKEEEVKTNSVEISKEDAELFETLKAEKAKLEAERVANEAKQKEELIEKVLKVNAHLTKELVSNMELTVLEALSKNEEAKADFSAQGITNTQGTEEFSVILGKPDPSKIKSGV